MYEIKILVKIEKCLISAIIQLSQTFILNNGYDELALGYQG